MAAVRGAPPGRQGAARRAVATGRPAAPRLAGQARSCGCAVGAAFSPLLRRAVVVRSGPRPRPRPDSTWHDGQYRPPRDPRGWGGLCPPFCARRAAPPARMEPDWRGAGAGCGGSSVAMAAIRAGAAPRGGSGRLDGAPAGPGTAPLSSALPP